MESKPEIKPVLRDAREEKKKKGGLAGWWSRLTGGGAGVGAGEAGGAVSGLESMGAGGGFGGLGGAGVSGGLLATKAGLIGLILIGSSVAGGLGFLGYRAFGPENFDNSGRYQLFAPRPAPAPSAGAEAVSPDGSSKSLSMFADANASKEAAPTNVDDAAAAGKAAASAAAPGGDKAANNNANVGGNKAALLKSGKLELAKLAAGAKMGGGGAAGGSAASAALPAATAPVAARGKTAASGTPKAASSSRALAGRRLGAGNSAFRQLGQVNGDQKGAASSRQAGTTYDGAGSKPVGTDAGIAAGGAGTGAGTNPTPNPTNGVDNGNRFPSPPGVEGHNVTPWQGAINTAIACIAGAALCLMLAFKIGSTKTPEPYTKGLVMALAGVAAILAMVAMAMGAMMMGGQYGQKFQGMMFVLAGGMMMAAAGTALIGAISAKEGAIISGNYVLMMALCGAGALGAALAAYLTPPKKMDSTYFNGGRPPDWNHR